MMWLPYSFWIGKWLFSYFHASNFRFHWMRSVFAFSLQQISRVPRKTQEHKKLVLQDLFILYPLRKINKCHFRMWGTHTQKGFWPGIFSFFLFFLFKNYTFSIYQSSPKNSQHYWIFFILQELFIHRADHRFIS